MRSSRSSASPILAGMTAVLVVGLLGATLWFLWSRSRVVPLVEATERPLVTDVVKKVIVSGSIEARQEIELKPRVSGILHRLMVEPGDQVKRGALIGEVQIIPDVVNLNEAELRRHAAEVAVQRTKQDLERAEALEKQGIEPMAELEKLRADYVLAMESASAAENRVRLLREGVAGKSRSAASATRIESPMDGTVLQVPVRPGASVINANSFNPGTTIAVVADMNDMIFRGAVDESDAGELTPGAPAEIAIGALRNRRFVGRLDSVAPKSLVKDGTTRFDIEVTFRAEGTIPLRAGYSASASIILARRAKVLAIDERTLSFTADRAFVEVEVVPSQFERREVRLGLSDGIHVEVLGGIRLDDRLRSTPSAALSR
jgi:HlyD family secretion protein